jgi:hypothetical protein
VIVLMILSLLSVVCCWFVFSQADRSRRLQLVTFSWLFWSLLMDDGCRWWPYVLLRLTLIYFTSPPTPSRKIPETSRDKRLAGRMLASTAAPYSLGKTKDKGKEMLMLGIVRGGSILGWFCRLHHSHMARIILLHYVACCPIEASALTINHMSFQSMTCNG